MRERARENDSEMVTEDRDEMDDIGLYTEDREDDDGKIARNKKHTHTHTHSHKYTEKQRSADDGN